MAAPVTVQLRNAESSILFMQQEHAKTLKGLHQELQKLQKKCAEVTFELAMKSGQDEESYEKKHKILEGQLKEKTRENVDLTNQLQQCNAKVNLLERQARMDEQHRKDEAKKHQRKVASLTGELEQRSNTVADLTTQLHQLKLRQQEVKHPSAEGFDRLRNPTPTPPPTDKPHRARRPKLRSSSISLLSGETPGLDSPDTESQRYIVTARCSNSASQHRYSTRRTDIVDLRPYLVSADRECTVTGRPSPPVLPPITPTDEQNVGKRRAIYSRRRAMMARSNPEFESSSVETLAVENVCSGDIDLRQLEQTKTD